LRRGIRGDKKAKRDSGQTNNGIFHFEAYLPQKYTISCN
jgi:hypothetical protein